MAGVARIGDDTTGICDIGELCCPHSRQGINITGSENVKINGMGVHRLGDTGRCNCVHNGYFKTTKASSHIFANGKEIARTGDETTCMLCGKKGVHMGASGNVFIGD